LEHQVSAVELEEDQEQCPQCLEKCHAIEALEHRENGCEEGAEIYKSLVAGQKELEAELQRQRLASRISEGEEATERKRALEEEGSPKREYEGRARVRLYGQGATEPCPLCKDDYLYSQDEIDDHWNHGCATVLERDREFATRPGRRRRSPPRASKHKMEAVEADQEVSESSSIDAVSPAEQVSEGYKKVMNEIAEAIELATEARMRISGIIAGQVVRPVSENSDNALNDALELVGTALQDLEEVFEDAVEHIEQGPNTAEGLPVVAAGQTIPALDTPGNTSGAAEASNISHNPTTPPNKHLIKSRNNYLRPDRPIDRIEELEYMNLADIATKEERGELCQLREQSDKGRVYELRSRIQQARQLQEHRDAGGTGYPFLWSKEVW